MRLHFENNIFVVLRSPRARPFTFLLLLITWRLSFGFGLIILRGSYKETFGRGPHNINKFKFKVAECSEVALFKKTFVIFKIKSMMYLRSFRLSFGDKSIF